MPFALLYISRNRVSPTDHAREMANILEVSLAYNEAHAITGALVATPTQFAQVLEGPRQAVTNLMERIEADPRHSDIAVVARETLPQRSFPRWSLAHLGNCDRLDEAIGKLSAAAKGSPSPGDVWALWNLMSELAYEQFSADPSRST